MLRSLAVWIILFLSAATSGAQTNLIDQESKGHCSPNIANVNGNVTITASCLDPKVVEIFLTHINAQQKSYKEKEKEVQNWIMRYNELLNRVGAAKAHEELRQQVTSALQKGNFDLAGKFQEKI